MGELSFGERAKPRTPGQGGQWAEFQSAESLVSFFAFFNFTLDHAKTSSLQFFGGLSCCRHHRTDLVVLTKDKVPATIQCTLRVVKQFSEIECILEQSFGCVDQYFIWVAHGCAGLFERTGNTVTCVNIADGRSYTECRLSASVSGQSPISTADTHRRSEIQHIATSQSTKHLDRQCRFADIDTMLRHPLLTKALASPLVTNAYDAMDLLVPRSGFVWEGDCHANMLYYRLIKLALAPAVFFKEPFGAAATRRDIALIMDGPAVDEAVPSQWSRLAVAFQILAGRANTEPLPGMHASDLMQWSMRCAQLAGLVQKGALGLTNSSFSKLALMDAGLECHNAITDDCSLTLSSFRFANNVESWLTPLGLVDILQSHLPKAKVDILKIDIDSFDVDVLHAALNEITASVIIVEFEFQVPPPFSWTRHFTTRPAPTWASMYPASLSYFVEMLGGLSFFLYKANHNDAVFIHADVAELFTDVDDRLEFPIDEWACYLRQAFSNEHTRIPLPYVREWLFAAHVLDTVEFVWGNLSQVSHPPFSFDLLAPRSVRFSGT